MVHQDWQPCGGSAPIQAAVQPGKAKGEQTIVAHHRHPPYFGMQSKSTRRKYSDLRLCQLFRDAYAKARSTMPLRNCRFVRSSYIASANSGTLPDSKKRTTESSR